MISSSEARARGMADLLVTSLRFLRYHAAAGQGKTARSSSLSGAFWFVLSSMVRLSEIGLAELRKPLVET
jgi:hypothetical protein